MKNIIFIFSLFCIFAFVGCSWKKSGEMTYAEYHEIGEKTKQDINKKIVDAETIVHDLKKQKDINKKQNQATEVAESATKIAHQKSNGIVQSNETLVRSIVKLEKKKEQLTKDVEQLAKQKSNMDGTESEQFAALKRSYQKLKEQNKTLEKILEKSKTDLFAVLEKDNLDKSLSEIYLSNRLEMHKATQSLDERIEDATLQNELANQIKSSEPFLFLKAYWAKHQGKTKLFLLLLGMFFVFYLRRKWLGRRPISSEVFSEIGTLTFLLKKYENHENKKIKRAVLRYIQKHRKLMQAIINLTKLDQELNPNLLKKQIRNLHDQGRTACALINLMGRKMRTARNKGKNVDESVYDQTHRDLLALVKVLGTINGGFKGSLVES